MKREPVFTWDEKTGHATCTLFDGNKTYVGEAHCHVDDLDVMSERTGYEIAMRRAQINFLIHVRDNEIKPGVLALKELLSEIDHSTKFNPKAYETLALYRKIRQKEFDLFAIKEELAREKESLKEYLAQKDIFYNQLRRVRKKAKEN